MRSKSPLAIMEQLIMIAVFAVAAALCVRSCVTARLVSMDIVRTDQAMAAAGNAVELFKAGRDYEIMPSGVYGDDWSVTSGFGTYSVDITMPDPDGREDVLEGIRVIVTDPARNRTYADITGWRQKEAAP